MRRPKAADLFLCMILFVLSASVGKISTTSSDDNLCLFSITTLMVLPSLGWSPPQSTNYLITGNVL
jgi:hypothetical protein